MSSHTDCSETQPPGTHDKDSSVRMPWREQEAGLLHNRNSYFSSQQLAAHGSTRRKVTAETNLNYSRELLAGLRDTRITGKAKEVTWSEKP